MDQDILTIRKNDGLIKIYFKYQLKQNFPTDLVWIRLYFMGALDIIALVRVLNLWGFPYTDTSSQRILPSLAAHM